MIALRHLSFLFCMLLTSSASADVGRVYTSNKVYEVTAKRWKNAVDGASFKSTSWIWNIGDRDKKHRNKARDTILMVPSQTSPESLTLVVWFHGCGGFSKKTFSSRIIPQIEEIVEDGNSVAIAIPEMPWSINTTTKCGRQGRVWTRPGELENYINDVKKHLASWAWVTHRVPLGDVRLSFIGHSAGGSALASAAKEGSLCNLKPDSIVWSDASYGYWLDRAWKSCIRDTDTSLHVLVRKWDKPHKNAERLSKVWKRVNDQPGQNIDIHYYVLNRKIWTHGRIGDNIFTITRLFPPGC